MPSCTQRQSSGVATTATRPLRAAVIGLGVGEAHVAAYRGHQACEVVALCDFNRDRLEEIGRKAPGAALHVSADAILEDPSIDVVSVASYDNYHCEQTVRALSAGKHVFVEKPICLNEDEALRIREALDANPHLKLSSNLILRKCPRFVALKQQIERGDFGELFLLEGHYEYGRLHKITEGWRGAIDFYSVVYGGAIHLVDLMLWLTGDEIVEVAAFGNQVASRDTPFRYNDTVVSVVRFAGGLVGKVGVSYGCVRPHFHDLKVYGTQATFINGSPDGVLYRSRDPDAEPELATEAYPGADKGELLHDFIDAIVGGTEPSVGTDDVFRAMSTCLAIEAASTSGAVCSVRSI